LAAELKAANPALNIEILGINRGDEALSNHLVTAYHQLPWLQDTVSGSVWTSWQATWRDVRILDARNQLLAVYNLTENDLGQPENRMALKQLLLDAARFVDSDNDGLSDDWEVAVFGNRVRGPEADSDGDGANDWAEYAFGSDPLAATSQPVFSGRFGRSGASEWFEVRFRRRAGAAVSYRVEGAVELVPWTGSALSVVDVLRQAYDGSGTGWYVCRLGGSALAQGRGFVRVVASPVAVGNPQASRAAMEQMPQITRK
jgi:hypothetical protein